MHWLPDDEIRRIVEEAHQEWQTLPCHCGPAPIDYCRTCEEFYFVHAPGCRLCVAKHDGHACVLIPYVAKPWKLAGAAPLQCRER